MLPSLASTRPPERAVPPGWMQRLRDADLRPTTARLAVLQAIAAAPDGLCADDVYRQLPARGTRASISTVYRVIHEFEDAGLLQREWDHRGTASYRVRPVDGGPETPPSSPAPSGLHRPARAATPLHPEGIAPLSPATRVLVVDDHADIREPLALYLARQGLQAAGAHNGACLREQLVQSRFDLVILDIMLPDADGLELCRHVTQVHGTPVILLSAKAATSDRVAGLESGADDYVVKPFDPAELLARVRTVLRRQARAPALAAHGQRLAFDGWTLDVARRELSDPAGQLVPLSDAELQILLAFASHPNEVLDRERLLQLTRQDALGVFDRSIDTQISRLRRKLENDPRRPSLIRTAWGDGYVFAAAVRPLTA